MATATRSQAKKPAPLPPRSAGPTKAERAAQVQGRAAPATRTKEEIARNAPRATGQRASVPATRPAAKPPADYGSSAGLPAFMRGDVGAGKENMTREDMDTPRLKLMQGLSPELTEYNDLRAGMFFHPAAEEILGESFVAVPIYFERQYILWRPRDSGGGIIARAADGVHWSPDSGAIEVQLDKKDGGAKVVWKLAKTVQQSGLANWGTMDLGDPNSPPAATLMYNFVLAFPELPDLMPAVFTFQRSTVKKGRQFITKLKTNRTPLYGLRFRFTSVDDHNGRGNEFKSVQVASAGLVEDEAMYRAYKEAHESMKAAGLQIKDIEGLQDDQPGDNDGDDGAGQAGPNKY